MRSIVMAAALATSGVSAMASPSSLIARQAQLSKIRLILGSQSPRRREIFDLLELGVRPGSQLRVTTLSFTTS